MDSIEIVKARVEYLEELSKQIPINQAFKVLSRLEEAKLILKMLSSNESN